MLKSWRFMNACFTVSACLPFIVAIERIASRCAVPLGKLALLLYGTS